jgi:N-acetylneuraminic acid mutarotase
MKKYLLVCHLAVTILIYSMSSYGQWIPVASLPGGNSAVRDGAVSWVIGNKCYIAGGSGHSDLLEYDPLNNTWTTKAPIPQGVTMFAMGFVLNGKGYICGGNNASFGYLGSLLEYDPASDSWTARAPFPTGKISGAFSFTIGNKAYVGCGDDSSFILSSVYEYDPSADIWTSKTLFSGGFRSLPYSFSIGSKGYVGGGFQFADMNDLWEYDPAADSWTAKAALPAPGREATASFSSDDYGFVGLGQSGFTTVYNNVYQYDPLNDAWTTLPVFSAGGRAWPVGFAFADKIYLGTGWNFTTFYNDLYYYDFVTGISETAGSHSGVYPNPSSQYIKVYSNEDKILKTEIYSFSGEMVISNQIKNNEAIDITQLPAGIYYLRGTTENNKIFENKFQVIR